MSGIRKQLSYLPDEELDQIQETAFRLLEEVGISLQHAAAQEMLHGLGCRIEGERTLIPREVIEWGLANVTPHTDFYNVDGSFAFAFNDGQLRFHNAGGLPFIYDLETGQRRRPTLNDIAEMTRLLDALPNVDVVIPNFGPSDVPPELLAVASTDIMLRNTRKPFSAAALDRPSDVPYVVEMAAACCGGMEAYRQRPTMYVSVSPVSPMTFPEDVTATIIAVAQSGTPFNTLPAPSLGATGPITLAGALALQHAEVIASFIIAAAAHPGALVTYCSRINPINLRTAVSSWGGPEIGMAGASASQLAHRHGLSFDTFGLCTSATRLDPQFAYERFANAFLPAMAGADILSGVGGADSVMTGGLEIAIIDDEIISLLKHMLAGPAVTEETLAFDVMKKVILGDGVFLGEMHTVKQMRKGAIWSPPGGRRSAASSQDATDLVTQARTRARQTVETHQVEPLPDDVLRQLDEIMERARRELVQK